MEYQILRGAHVELFDIKAVSSRLEFKWLVCVINLFFAQTDLASVRRNTLLVIQTFFFIAVIDLFLSFQGLTLIRFSLAGFNICLSSYSYMFICSLTVFLPQISVFLLRLWV